MHIGVERNLDQWGSVEASRVLSPARGRALAAPSPPPASLASLAPRGGSPGHPRLAHNPLAGATRRDFGLAGRSRLRGPLLRFLFFRPDDDLVDDRSECVDEADVVALLPDQLRRTDRAGGIDVLAAGREIVGERVRRGTSARARVDAINLAGLDEGWRTPRVDPLPLDRLRDLRLPETAQVLESPVREVARKIGDDLDPLRVGVLDRRFGGRRMDHEDVPLVRLDGAEVGHVCRIAAA